MLDNQRLRVPGISCVDSRTGFGQACKKLVSFDHDQKPGTGVGASTDVGY